MIVVDACTLLGWYLPDELGDINVQRSAVEFGIYVPAIWPLEIENVLLQAERRKRIDAKMAELILVEISETFDIKIENRSELFGAVLPLARAHHLTSYDAAYLDLALRRRLPLITDDKKLQSAANALGIPTSL